MKYLLFLLCLLIISNHLFSQGLLLNQKDNQGNYIYINNNLFDPILKIGDNFIESNNGLSLDTTDVGSLQLQRNKGNLTIGPTTSLYDNLSDAKINIRSNHDTIADIHFESSGVIHNESFFSVHLNTNTSSNDGFYILNGSGNTDILFTVTHAGSGIFKNDLFLGGTVTENWPDYVFKPDYKLRTISDLEKEINKKGHLPGIPSAEEIDENGLQIGLMNAKLLEKIEELTLYVIDLQKQINELQKD